MTLRDLRKQAGKSCAEVAEALGVGLNAIYHYERGEREVGLSQVIALSKLYDMPIEQIVFAQLNSHGSNNGGRRICRKEHKRLYQVYRNIIQRCTNPNNPDFKHYGQQGVKVCEEWIGVNGFDNFAEWALNNGYDENAKYGDCTLDRIQVDGNYEPSNCRWVSFVVQNNNRRRDMKWQR